VIRRDGRFLLATRPPESRLAGKWEFPGGKLRDEETPQECIRREIREELGLTVTRASEIGELTHRYPDIAIALIFLECDVPPGADPTPHEGQDVGWFALDEPQALDLAPADRRFVHALQRMDAR
jgi:8-oxo-dGTP diphosphatase